MQSNLTPQFFQTPKDFEWKKKKKKHFFANLQFPLLISIALQLSNSTHIFHFHCMDKVLIMGRKKKKGLSSKHSFFNSNQKSNSTTKESIPTANLFA